MVLKKALLICYSSTLKIENRDRLNNTYSEWIDILFGVSEGSIFSPLLFNIFLFVLFLSRHEIPVANYVDESTLYCSGLKSQMF